MMALSSPHRGRKVWPQWLREGGRAFGAPDLQSSPPTLPFYERRITERRDHPYPGAEVRTAGQDDEDYLAGHRWGFLLERMSCGSVDWRTCIEECVQWTKDNADTADPIWEPYSACERIANFLVFMAAVPAEEPERRIPTELREFLGSSVRWVYEHLEYYGPARTNNHILNNARALVLGGIACQNERALSAGMQIFRQCLPKLVLSGGFLRERSSHYQLIVLNWVLDAWRFVAAAEGTDDEGARFLLGHAEQMLAAASMLCDHGNSLLVLVGDVSPDLTPAQSIDRLKLLYSDRWRKTNWPARGCSCIDGWFRLCKDEEIVIGNFPEGKFPWEYPNHGHSDLTGFVWLHGGREILADLGRNRYTPDEISLAQVGASGHNVPTVNDLAPLCESVTRPGGWLPRPYAAAQLRATTVADGIALMHDGFARATPVSRHTRRIELLQDGLRVVDSFEGEGMVALAFFWHFGESFESFDTVQMLALGRSGSVRVELQDLGGTIDGRSLTAELFPAYISRAYGHAAPSVSVRLSGRVQLPASFGTRFSWLGGAR